LVTGTETKDGVVVGTSTVTVRWVVAKGVKKGTATVKPATGGTAFKDKFHFFGSKFVNADKYEFHLRTTTSGGSSSRLLGSTAQAKWKMPMLSSGSHTVTIKAYDMYGGCAVRKSVAFNAATTPGGPSCLVVSTKLGKQNKEANAAQDPDALLNSAGTLPSECSTASRRRRLNTVSSEQTNLMLSTITTLTNARSTLNILHYCDTLKTYAKYPETQVLSKVIVGLDVAQNYTRINTEISTSQPQNRVGEI